MPAQALFDVGNNVQNFIGDQIQNAENRKWSEKMYKRQYEDNLHLWNLQNDYNTPQKQMQRYTEAGLNPNLIYGQGNSGNAGLIQSPNPQPRQFRHTPSSPPQISSIYDLKIKQAQVDNLKADNTVKLEEAELKRAQTNMLKTSELDRRFDYDFKSEFRGVSADWKKEQLRKLQNDIDLNTREDARKALLVESNLKTAARKYAESLASEAHTRADTLRIYKTLETIENRSVLDRLEIDLKRKGLTWSDPLYMRLASNALTALFDGKKIESFEKSALKGASFEEYYKERNNGNYGGKYKRQFRHQ